MVIDELFYDSGTCLHCKAILDKAENGVFFSDDLMDDILKEIYDEQKDKADEAYVNKKLFGRTKEVLNDAVDEGLVLRQGIF